MEGKDCTDGTRCLCRLESNGEFLLVSETATIPPDNNFKIRELPSTSSGTISKGRSKVQNVFIQVSHALFHNASCTCHGWKQYPCEDDPEHSDEANTVLQSVAAEVKTRWRSKKPPIVHLDLCKYRYAPGDERYHSYYFLYVHAGKPNDNFFLYIKTGLLFNDHIVLIPPVKEAETIPCDP